MRIVLVNRSQPLEQMLAYVVEQGAEIAVVGEADDIAESSQIVAQDHPQWLFLLVDSQQDMIKQLQDVRAAHSSLNVAAFEEDGKRVWILHGTEPGEDLNDRPHEWEEMPMRDFVALLTKQPSTTGDVAAPLTDKRTHRA